MDYKVEGHTGIVKRDNAFVVAVDGDEYQRALARRAAHAKRAKLEKRVELLEKQVAQLLKLLHKD